MKVKIRNRSTGLYHGNGRKWTKHGKTYQSLGHARLAVRYYWDIGFFDDSLINSDFEICDDGKTELVPVARYIINLMEDKYMMSDEESKKSKYLMMIENIMTTCKLNNININV